MKKTSLHESTNYQEANANENLRPSLAQEVNWGQRSNFSILYHFHASLTLCANVEKLQETWEGFLRVKGQAKITKCYFLWVGAINMQSLSGHYLMCQQVTMVFLLLLVYLGTVAYISVEISLGSFWRRDILRVKGQALFTNCNFLWLCVHGVICNCWVATIWCAIKYPWCLYFFSLSKCCCLHLCRNKFGLLLVWGSFKGQWSRIYHKLQHFMTLCDMQSSGNYSMRH